MGVYNRNPVPNAKGGLGNNDPFPPFIVLNQSTIDQSLAPLKKERKTAKLKNEQQIDHLSFNSDKQAEMNKHINVYVKDSVSKEKMSFEINIEKPIRRLSFEIPPSENEAPTILNFKLYKDGKFERALFAHAITSAPGTHPVHLIHYKSSGWQSFNTKYAVIQLDYNREIQGKYKVELEFKKATNTPFLISSIDKIVYGPKEIIALRTDKDLASKKRFYLKLNDTEFQQTLERIAQLDKKIPQTEKKVRELCQITVAVKPRPVRLLPKGNWQDKSGEIVQPAVPAFLGKINKEGRATRLDLAEWLTSQDNPLTSRTLANRLWKQFFGRGLAADLTDLGAQGQAPENPELLDLLATELKSNWDIKALVKTIVSSRAYRQSSNAQETLKKYDPFNDYLARQNSRRLEAEFLRDNLLEISSLLVHNQGGSAVKPYQPEGYYKDLNFPRRVYQADNNDQQYRRGVYMHRQRTYLHPMLKAFDAPSREQCVAARSVSNTPLQALNLLNDPSFVEAAKNFAQSTLTLFKNKNMRLHWMFEKSTGRTPDATELAQLQKIADTELKYYSDKPKEATELLKTGLKVVDPKLDPKELAAWTSVARIMLNLHETITVY